MTTDNPTTAFAALLRRAKQYDMPHVKVPIEVAEQVLTAMPAMSDAELAASLCCSTSVAFLFETVLTWQTPLYEFAGSPLPL